MYHNALRHSLCHDCLLHLLLRLLTSSHFVQQACDWRRVSDVAGSCLQHSGSFLPDRQGAQQASQ